MDDKNSTVKDARIFSFSEIEKMEKENQEGKGIFFSVNSMTPGKRDQKSVIGINAWIVEIDGMEKEKQRQIIEMSPIFPSMIIESKSSYHLYWFAENGTVENWKTVCNGLRNFFDGDPAVIDISRVLRVPGFKHLKDPKDPFEIKIVYSSDKKYTETEMLFSFTDTRSIQDIKTQGIEKQEVFKKEFDDDYFWERVKNMDTENVLTRISGSRLVGNESITFLPNSNGTKQIYCNGKSTGAWLDKNGKIGSTSKGGPNWTNFVFRYGNCDGKKLYQWIKDEYPEMIKSDKIKPKEKQEIKIVKESEGMNYDTVEYYTRGNKSVDRTFGMMSNDLVVVASYPGIGKTAWTCWIANQNGKNGVKVVYLSLELTPDALKTRHVCACLGLNKFEFQEMMKHKTYDQYKKDYMNKKYKEFDENYELIGLSDPTWENIKEMIETKAKEGVKIVVVDNLGKIRKEAGDSENDHQKKVTGELQTLKNELGITIILVHHYNKPKAGEQGQQGGMHKVSGSQKISDNATIMIEIRRETDPFTGNTNITKLYQYKDTFMGNISEVEIAFDKGSFIDLTK